MKKKYVIPSIVQEFMFTEETVMLSYSDNNPYSNEDGDVLVKGQDAVYSTTTVEWDDWE